MKIEKNIDYLSVSAKLNFGYENCLFCGMPWVLLTASKEKTRFYGANTIRISVLDNDDYSLGLFYKTDDEHFFDVLHELINWIRDHEQGINSYNDLCEIFDFYPDLGCERRIM